MEIIQVLKNLYEKNNIEWVNEVEDFDPVIINKWLSMDLEIQKQVRYLDKYVYILEPKQFLLLAWSIVPKKQMPFITYIKKSEDTEDKYDFIWNRVKKELQLSDNDFEKTKKYLFKDFELHKSKWFKSFGVEKELWREEGLDFDEMKGNNIQKSGLEEFFA